MNNVEFSLGGESYVANKLDAMKIKYWWNPSQRNEMGADLITEYGAIDVKIAKPQIKTIISKKTKKRKTRRTWHFNLHHHGIKQDKIDFFICIVTKYEKEPLYFIFPKQICKNLTFSISERQLNNKIYHYFLEAWDIITGQKKGRFVNKHSQPIRADMQKILNKLKRIDENRGYLASQISQLIARFGTKKKVAEELGITMRYVLMLEKGEKAPSKHLRKLIKVVLNASKN